MSKKANARFHQVNQLVDRVIQNLDSSQALLLLVAWRHADEKGYFTVSANRFAQATGLSVRQVKYILKRLRQARAIREVVRGSGTRASTYLITGQPCEASGEV